MRVRSRLILAIGLTMSGAAIGVYTISRGPLMQGFGALEDERARGDIYRVSQALGAMVSEVHSKSVDWANWDSAYEFMKDRNRAKLRAAIPVNSMKDLRIDMVLLMDYSGQIAFSYSLPQTKSVRPLEAHSVQSALASGTFLQRVSADKNGKSGIVLVNDLPLAVSVRQIRGSDGKGEGRGWFVFVRSMGAQFVSDLRRVTRQDSAIMPASKLAPTVQSTFRNSGAGQPMIVQAIDDQRSLGYSAIRDVNGSTVAAVQTTIPRKVSVYGRSIVGAITWQLLSVWGALSLIILYVVERFALIRLQKLTKQVEQIRDQSGGSRIDLPGKDELSSLATRINEMLTKLELGAAALREREEQLRIQNETLELKVQERTLQIEHEALHDKLTGLPNRTLFMDRIDLALEKSRRSGHALAALFIDLDNFKLVNDSLGHDVGDALLIEMGSLLSDSVRPGDTVARLGGDEFTVLLEGLESVHEAEEVAQRILSNLRHPIKLGNRESFACASIGIAYTANPDLGGIELLKNADTAMYRAKAGGKSGYVLYDASMNDYAVERLELETSLRKALDRGEISVSYQPLINLEGGQLVGAEALARWAHPERGQVPPKEFIAIAEDTGLIIPIGYWIMEQACIQASDWAERHKLPEFVISVNLSGKQLQRDDVIAQVRTILERTALPASSLKLEITESTLMEDRDDVVEKMVALKQLGVQLALDDFGTGYSSLSTLRSFPIDTLKIDRAFIGRLGEEDGAMAIVEAITALAKTMRMNVTAEGVETTEQEEISRRLGCETGQGYLYDPPLTSDKFEDRLSGRDEQGELPKAA